MKINNIKYIMCLIIATQSLCGMQQLALYGIEKPVPCTTIANMVNVVPGVIAPVGVGCVGDKGIAVLEKDRFGIWDTKKQKFIIKRSDDEKEKAMHDFAINKKGTKIAFCGVGFLSMYDMCTGKRRLKRIINHSDFYSIAFSPQDEILVYSDDHFAIGQLYDADGSGAAIIGRSGYETVINFIGIDATSNVYALPKGSISLPQLCVAMTFHPNNKLFFLLDEHNTIHCFDYVTKECIYSLYCKDQEKISVNGLEKRLALSRDGKILYAALKDKVVAIPLDGKKQLFFMLSALVLYDEGLLPSDVIWTIMDNALKVSHVPLWNYLDK